jgi:hypothetical protein
VLVLQVLWRIGRGETTRVAVSPVATNNNNTTKKGDEKASDQQTGKQRNDSPRSSPSFCRSLFVITTHNTQHKNISLHLILSNASV